MNKAKDLEVLQQNYSGKTRRLIQTIIEEAKKYHATDLKSPEDLELLWSEYKAAGDKETIERIIKLVSRPERSDLDNPAKQMLIKMAPYHYEIYEMLIKKANTSRGLEKILLDDIVDAIKYYAFDPAREYMKRGINYYNLKKYDEALEEYKKSLSYFPDYSAIYCNMANVYEAKERVEGVKGSMEKAIELYKKAININPEDYTTIYDLGLLYFGLKEYDEAIKCYLKVLAIYPEHGEYHRQLARAYDQKDDKENAAIYYKNFLKYGRKDAFAYAPLIKHYLASIGKPVEEDPNDIVVMFQNKRFEDLDKKLASQLENKNKDKEGNSQIFKALQTLCDNSDFEVLYQIKIKLLKEWLAQNPSSYFANVCLGDVYISYAWFARGGGFASTVTREGSNLFRQRLLTARGYLEKAYSLNQSDPYVPALLIKVATGLGSEREEMEKQFQRAILADPTDKMAYSGKLEYLKEKWYGSEEEMFAFARETAKKAPPGSRLPGILLEAHWEMYFRSNSNVSYFRDPVVWKEIKEVYQTLSHSFPSSKRIHNWFARTAYLAGDYETARKEIEIIGDDWLSAVWGPKRSFDEVKRELFTK
jgi:tetratricopeptide (TPR) repeat protein